MMMMMMMMMTYLATVIDGVFCILVYLGFRQTGHCFVFNVFVYVDK